MSKKIQQINDELERMKYLKHKLEDHIYKLNHLLKQNNKLYQDSRPNYLKDKSLGQVKVLNHLIVNWLLQ